MRVVDDLLADIHGLPIHLKRTLDRVDGPLDSGAVAPGRGEDDPLHQTAARIARSDEDRVRSREAWNMRKPAARGVGAAGSPKLLTAAQGQVRAPRCASPSGRDAISRVREGQWAGRPIF